MKCNYDFWGTLEVFGDSTLVNSLRTEMVEAKGGTLETVSAIFRGLHQNL